MLLWQVSFWWVLLGPVSLSIVFFADYLGARWSTPSEWSDLSFLNHLGYFGKLIFIFWKDEVDQWKCDILGYFLHKEYFDIFTLIKIFKWWFQEVWCRSFGLSNLPLFELATVWATLKQIGRFFPDLLVTLHILFPHYLQNKLECLSLANIFSPALY